MLVTFQFKTGTYAELAAANPELIEGEPAFESDTGRLRIGDGEHRFNDLLPLSFNPALLAELSTNAVNASLAAIEARDEAVAAAGGASAASDTQIGVVELATLAEVLAGTDPVRVVTVAGLAAKLASLPATGDASTSAKGVVRLATNAEAAGTAADLAVTPSGLSARLAAFGGGSGSATPVHTVASQTAMLALAATKGDIAVRTDAPRRAFILSNDTPAALGSWVELPAVGVVPSVAGRTGAITLTLADVADTASKVSMTPAERSYIAGLPATLSALAEGGTTSASAMSQALTDAGHPLQAQMLVAAGATDEETRDLIAGIFGYIRLPATGKLVVNRDYTAASAASVTRPYGTDTTKVIVRWRATDGTLTNPAAYIPNNDEIRRVRQTA